MLTFISSLVLTVYILTSNLHINTLNWAMVSITKGVYQQHTRTCTFTLRLPHSIRFGYLCDDFWFTVNMKRSLHPIFMEKSSPVNIQFILSTIYTFRVEPTGTRHDLFVFKKF